MKIKKKRILFRKPSFADFLYPSEMAVIRPIPGVAQPGMKTP